VPTSPPLPDAVETSVLPTLGKTLRPVRQKNLPAEIRLFESIWADENFVISTRKLKT
jgi:hypothetical protein